MKPTVAKIYLENFKSNLRFIKSKMSPKAKLCVAVKADAYGHGAVECSRAAIECGAEFLAIARISEGKILKDAGINARILLLSLCYKDEIPELVNLGITPLVFDEEYAALISAEAKKQGKENYAVHLAVDTGMGRIGCLPENAGKIAKKIAALGLKIEGICTHFSVADSFLEEDQKYTEEQFKKFLFAADLVEKEGIKIEIKHCANSALTLLNPETHLDMCRPGIICYGYYPGDLKGNDLKPVMALVTHISAIREIPAGSQISYGRTWTSAQNTRIAVLPIGYDDGLLRRHAGINVSINGKSFPIRGRICMDQCMIEIGNEQIERWSEAVVFGPAESGALQTADDLAEKSNTISYEITCTVGSRVERVFE